MVTQYGTAGPLLSLCLCQLIGLLIYPLMSPLLLLLLPLDVLVGLHIDPLWLGSLHGRLHQMLCRPHAQLESQAEEGTSNNGYFTKACRYSQTKGESYVPFDEWVSNGCLGSLQSRERSNGQANGHHRSSREPSNSRSGGGAGAGHRSDRPERESRGQQSHSSSHPSSQQLQLPLTSLHPPPSQSSSSSHGSSSHHGGAGYHPSSVLPVASSSSSASAGAGPFPPTLVVNLPPPAKDAPGFDPPPPYPGMPKPSAPPITVIAPPINCGPSHGYGEGRGHYNRQGQANVPTAAKNSAPKSMAGKKGDHEAPSKSRR